MRVFKVLWGGEEEDFFVFTLPLWHIGDTDTTDCTGFRASPA
jgi:hypothetical protein